MIEIDKRKALIRHHPCFSTLKEENIEGLAELCSEHHYQAGDIILSEAELVDAVYLIAQGEIEVERQINQSGQIKHIPQAILREGDSIGLDEEGFFSKTGLRTATLTAISKVVVVGWPIDIFLHFLEQYPDFRASMKNAAQAMLRMSFIKKAAPFVDLPNTAVEKLAREIGEITLLKDHIIFNQGDVAEDCYLICSGEVEIFLPQNDGNKKIISNIKPWDLFGEGALLTESKRSVSARMSESGKLLVMRSEQLQELMAHHNTSESILALIIEHSRPTQALNIEHYHRKNEEGQEFVILKDTHHGRYFQLSEEGWFVWQHLDGQKNLQDITIELYKERKIFAPEAVADTVLNLADAGFAVLPKIHIPKVAEPNENLTRWQRVKQKLHDWRYFKHIFYDIDSKLSRTYKAGAHVFFTFTGQILMAGTTLIGLVFFCLFLEGISEKIPPLPHIILMIIALFVFNLFLTIFHELAHGFATKYYKHDVHRAGIIFNWFGLTAFVDTSDMWLSGRKQRVMVSFAGPYLDLFMAGIFAFLGFFISQPAVALFFWLLALILYYGVLKNLNPMQENDGYYILRDALNDQQLRTKAFSWLKKFNFKNARTFLIGHRAEITYWSVCDFFLVIALVVAFAAQHYLRLLLPSHILGISTDHLFWLLPALVILNFIFTLWNFLRKI